MTKKLIAVYGTLKRNYPNNYLLKNAKFLGSLKTEPIFTMHSLGWFPAITLDGNTSIHMEVYEVNKEILERVYRLEGYSGKRDCHSNYYDTLDIKTQWGNAEVFYSPRKITSRIIKSGEWNE